MTNVPPTNGPSQESSPVYVALIRLASTPLAAASNVIVHIGVGTPSPPAGKTMRIASDVPESEPLMVPVLNLWHDAHVPSAAFSGARSAVPDNAGPFCATIHDIFSEPCGSLPVPFHAPAMLSDDAAGDVGAGADDPQASADAIN